MTSVLVLYASTHGHTAKIAERIAEELRACGAEPEVRAIDAGVDPAGFDLVVVGASIHGGHHQPEAVAWVKERAATLNAVPSALFSVSLTAADDTDESHAATRGYIDGLLTETGWQPRLAVPVAGALQYLEYGFVTRLVVRLMMKHADKPTDPHRDFDFTDWEAVRAFARDVAALAS